MNRVLKLLSFLYLICAFIAESFFFALSTPRDERNSAATYKKKANRIAHYSDRALRILDIRTYLMDVPHDLRSGLIVSNHLSYIDVLVLARVAPFLFITSVEVKNSFGLGLITRLAGCLFVERRSRNDLKQESSRIAQVMASGIPTVLFPEGTSSDGSSILPFRAALFQSAIDAKVPVHLFHLSYNDECVPYYGKHEFMQHLFKLCGSKKIRAQLLYLGRLQSKDTDRKMLANLAQDRINFAHVSGISRSTRSQPVMEQVWKGREPGQSEHALV